MLLDWLYTIPVAPVLVPVFPSVPVPGVPALAVIAEGVKVLLAQGSYTSLIIPPAPAPPPLANWLHEPSDNLGLPAFPPFPPFAVKAPVILITPIACSLMPPPEPPPAPPPAPPGQLQV